MGNFLITRILVQGKIHHISNYQVYFLSEQVKCLTLQMCYKLFFNHVTIM